jgi:adenosine deaminase
MRRSRIISSGISSHGRFTSRDSRPHWRSGAPLPRRAGLKRTVHAGESSGPEGVRDAIELLGADRLGHRVRAIENNAVVALLAERGISLRVCPTSNIALKVYPSMEAHPLDRHRRAVVRVSINTYDPVYLGRTCPGNTRSRGRRMAGPRVSSASSRARRSRPVSPGRPTSRRRCAAT